MAKASLEVRLKAGPWTPLWKPVVAKNKDIGDLKGDVDKLLADYDKTLKDGSDAGDMIIAAWGDMAKAISEAVKTEAKDYDARDKLLEKLRKDSVEMGVKIVAEANKIRATDATTAINDVSKFVDEEDNYVQQANDIFKSMIDIRQTYLDAIRKSYGEAQKILDKSQSDRKSAEAQCDKLDDSVRKTITDMQKQAIKTKKDKLVTAMEGFIKQI